MTIMMLPMMIPTTDGDYDDDDDNDNDDDDDDNDYYDDMDTMIIKTTMATSAAIDDSEGQ